MATMPHARQPAVSAAAAAVQQAAPREQSAPQLPSVDDLCPELTCLVWCRALETGSSSFGSALATPRKRFRSRSASLVLPGSVRFSYWRREESVPGECLEAGGGRGSSCCSRQAAGKRHGEGRCQLTVPSNAPRRRTAAVWAGLN